MTTFQKFSNVDYPCVKSRCYEDLRPKKSGSSVTNKEWYLPVRRNNSSSIAGKSIFLLVTDSESVRCSFNFLFEFILRGFVMSLLTAISRPPQGIFPMQFGLRKRTPAFFSYLLHH